MSNPIKDGGPAFPLISHTDCNGFRREAQDGMTLRDYFAGQALAGWLACPNTKPLDTTEKYAVEAYRLADAMIAAREAKP